MNGNLFTTGETDTSIDLHMLTNVIIDGNDVNATNVDEVVISDSNEHSSKEEEAFYAKLNVYKAGLKYSEKMMISLNYYQKITFTLKQSKGGKTTGVDTKFYGWCKKHFKIDITSGIDILCSVKNNRRIIIIESYFTILKHIHEETGHGGRDKMRYEVNQHYYWLPSQVIDIFLQCCISCQVRKSIKTPVVPSAIISVGFMTRLQIDLIDLRTRPDKDFQWILHGRDHYSKYSWAYPLRSKEANFIAEHLITLFYQFGACKILQSDNGKEFTACVIKNLKNIWPGLVIINGRPRHPQSQGLVERGNATLCNILGKYMEDRKTTSWTTCLLPAVFSMNTSLARGVSTTPYEVVFGQKPRLDYDLWKSIAEQGITNEEDLPLPILERLMDDSTSTSMSSNVSNTGIVDQEPIDSITTTLDAPDTTDAPDAPDAHDTPDALSTTDALGTTDVPDTTNVLDTPDALDTSNLIHQQITNSIPESATSSSRIETVCNKQKHPPVTMNSETTHAAEHVNEVDDDTTLTGSPHSIIRKRATASYLSNANKRIKAHNQFVQDLSTSCSIGDYVGIKIDKVDRTNTDPKILPSVVYKKEGTNIKVACEYGIIGQWWPLDSVVKLTTVPEKLTNLQITELNEISIITASKLYVRGSVNGVTCSCKAGCKTKLCACKKNNVLCSTKCHKNGSRCVNIE